MHLKKHPIDLFITLLNLKYDPGSKKDSFKGQEKINSLHGIDRLPHVGP